MLNMRNNQKVHKNQNLNLADLPFKVIFMCMSGELPAHLLFLITPGPKITITI